jgi:CDP-paratose 2-epimerase
MKILITGGCGFVGSTLARRWRERHDGDEVWAVDNFIRPGSEQNRRTLDRSGVRVRHADLRCASDIDGWPRVDAVIDAAANPSVMAGVDGLTSSRQLVEHNLYGTVNLLEYCRRHTATLIVLSTSRVYSIPPLAHLPVRVAGRRLEPDRSQPLPAGVTAAGVSEAFSTMAPVSLYGATKVASEQLALEYGIDYGFPVWINRCGVMAGGGQFGRADQGIFSFWINSWMHRRPLRYLGFGGHGHQVRDCLHPADLLPLLERQLACTDRGVPPIVNVGGGLQSAMSLRELSDWCRERLGDHAVRESAETRPFDLPWVVLDASLACATWQWTPSTAVDEILTEILDHAAANPTWLEASQGT